MIDHPKNQPLWAAMCNAYLIHNRWNATVESDAAAWAAEIRAVADWLVPDEGPRPGLSYAGTRWEVRQELRQRLLAEADRAERGEG
jgi:hypothetical protein